VLVHLTTTLLRLRGEPFDEQEMFIRSRVLAPAAQVIHPVQRRAQSGRDVHRRHGEP